jgi:hypothetical protein
MKEHDIVTKLRRPLENFTSDDLAKLIKAYDEVRQHLADAERVVEAADYVVAYQGTVKESEMYSTLNAVLGDYYNARGR